MQNQNFTYPPSLFLINCTLLNISLGTFVLSTVIKTCSSPRNPGRGQPTCHDTCGFIDRQIETYSRWPQIRCYHLNNNWNMLLKWTHRPVSYHLDFGLTKLMFLHDTSNSLIDKISVSRDGSRFMSKFKHTLPHTGFSLGRLHMGGFVPPIWGGQVQGNKALMGGLSINGGLMRGT